MGIELVQNYAMMEILLMAMDEAQHEHMKINLHELEDLLLQKIYDLLFEEMETDWDLSIVMMEI